MTTGKDLLLTTFAFIHIQAAAAAVWQVPLDHDHLGNTLA